MRHSTGENFRKKSIDVLLGGVAVLAVLHAGRAIGDAWHYNQDYATTVYYNNGPEPVENIMKLEEGALNQDFEYLLADLGGGLGLAVYGTYAYILHKRLDRFRQPALEAAQQ